MDTSDQAKNVRNHVKQWWNKNKLSTDPKKKKEFFTEIVEPTGTKVGDYTLFVPSGGTAYVIAIKDDISLTIFNFGQPDNPTQFRKCLESNLNSSEESLSGGGKRKTRRNRKSNKSRKGKSRKGKSSRRRL
tara:strand:+ start:93 stop:485 length:393 start_codon:yes stop_codon:yes gene_type:complete